MANKKRISWFSSSAAIVTYCLLGASTILIGIGILIILKNNCWDIPNYILNLIIGLSTNLLGIIVTIVFVQYFLDKQSQKDEKERETAKIKRFDRIMKIMLERYALFFYCITTPIIKRENIETLPLNVNFDIKDMCDMYSSSLCLSENIMGSAIETFYETENDLRQYIIKTIENIDFNYHKPLKECLLSFVEISIGNEVKGAILGNTKIYSGKEKISEIAIRGLKDSPQNWVEKGDNNQLDSNIMFSYYSLYKTLKKEAELLNEYNEYISKV